MSGLVERLAAKYVEEFDPEYIDGTGPARWWLNAIADEIDVQSEFAGRPAFRAHPEDVAQFLREQAERAP